MKVDESLIEQIVSDVMEQLQTGGTTARSGNLSDSSSSLTAEVVMTEAVITGELLEQRAGSAKQIHIGAESVLTPSARDYLHRHHIDWSRIATDSTSSATSAGWLAIVVSETPAVASALADLSRTNQFDRRPQSAGSPREAAESAVALLSRNEADGVVIIGSGAAVAACRANRNRQIRAAAIREISCVHQVDRLMGANLYCINPADMSQYELRNMLREITTVGRPSAPAGWEA